MLALWICLNTRTLNCLIIDKKYLRFFSLHFTMLSWHKVSFELKFEMRQHWYRISRETLSATFRLNRLENASTACVGAAISMCAFVKDLKSFIWWFDFSSSFFFIFSYWFVVKMAFKSIEWDFFEMHQALGFQDEMLVKIERMQM